MPVINRIRIINIKYDNKLISDTIFDYHSGMNVLMNLANGSGKTVMITTLIQAILPGEKVADYQVKDYLDTAAHPSFVLIEWKRDTSAPSFFLTGIVMYKNRTDNDEDSAGTLNYMTFIHAYTQSNDFDIEHIPLTEPTGDKKRYPTYNEIRELLNRQKRRINDKDIFDVFDKSHRNDYWTTLRRYNIYKDEWKLLAKANSAEKGGGLKAVFDKLSTSDMLFDRWILENISDSFGDLRETLIEFITSYYTDVINNAEIFKEKEQYEKSFADLNELIETFKEYSGALDKKEQQERMLAGVLLHKNELRNMQENECKNNENELNKCENEKVLIGQEKASEHYLEVIKKLDEANRSLEAAKGSLEESVLSEQMTKRALDAMRAAEFAEKRNTAQTALLAAQNMIRTLATGTGNERLFTLGATLFSLYSERETAIGHDIECAINNEEHFKQKKAELKQANDSLQKEYNDVTKKLAILENDLEHLRKERSKHADIIGEEPDSNIMGEVIPDSVAALRERLASSLVSAQNAVQNCINNISDTQMKQEKAAGEEAELQKRKLENEKSLAKQELFTDDIEHQVETVSAVLRKYEITDDIFQTQAITSRLKEKLNAEKEREEKLKSHLRSLENKLYKIGKDQLHSSESFSHLLDDSGISYITGDAYLKAQNSSFATRLLDETPILPYCFIVNDKDFEKTIVAAEGYTEEMVCPIIRRSDIEKLILSDDGAVCFENVKLYGFSERRVLNNADREEYINVLNDERNGLMTAVSETTFQIDLINEDLHTFTSFNITREEYELAHHELERLNNEKTELEAEDKRLHDLKEHLKQQHHKLQSELEERKADSEKCSNKLTALEEYIDISQKITEQTHTLRCLEERFSMIDDEISKNNIEIDTIIEQSKDNAVKLQSLKERFNNTQTKKNNFVSYSSDEQTSGSIEELEIEFNELERAHKKEISNYENQCTAYQKEIDEMGKKLRRFCDIPPEEIPDRYDPDEETKLARNYEKAKTALDEAKSEVSQLGSRIKYLQSDLESRKEELHDNGLTMPLDENLIKGMYSERLKKCNEWGNHLNEAIRTSRQKINVLSDEITRLLRVVDTENVASVIEVDKEIDITEEIEKLNSYKLNVESTKNITVLSYETLCSVHSGNHKLSQALATLKVINCDTFDSALAVFDRMSEVLSLITDHIQVDKTILSNTEQLRKSAIIQIFEHGEKLHNEVCRINSSANTVIQGKRQPILFIDVPVKISSDQAMERIALFIDEAASWILEEFSGRSYDEIELRERIGVICSDKNIYNAYTNTSSITVKVLKVEADYRTTRLIKWEEYRSGGEDLVTNFITYAAMTEYTRERRSTTAEKISGESTSSVFIFDNPFGEASSEHLVKALIAVTNKFRMQLICFSDLKQASIVNRFDLIYQLTLRKAVYSKISRLETEKIIDKTEHDKLSILEYASERSQLSLFE